MTSEGKIQGQKLFCQSNQGSSESLFILKKFGGSVELQKTPVSFSTSERQNQNQWHHVHMIFLVL